MFEIGLKCVIETVLYVGDLSKDVDRRELERAFRRHGRIASCDIVEDPVTK